MANKPNNPALWSRAKSMAKQKFDVYPCVPMDSQALTKDGWKYYDQLSIGELILTYNQKTGFTEWSPIRALQFFEKAPLIRLYKSQTNCKVRCTPNHKWVLAEANSKYPDNLVEAQHVTKNMKLKTSAQVRPDQQLGVDLKSFSKTDSWVAKVLDMSIPQLQSFFASGIVYDGNDKGLSAKGDKQTFGFSQKNQDHGEAMEIAAVLLGYRVCSIKKKDNPAMRSWTFISRDYESTQNLNKEDIEPADVWCPTTDNQTWIMKQDGYVTITGNSAYANGWAAKWYKSKGGTWRKAMYGMEVPMMEQGGKPEWLVEAQLKAQGYSGNALQQKMNSMAQGGEPSNEGFQALPEYVQEKIMSNMAFGGYLPEMFFGGKMKKNLEQAAPMLLKFAPMLFGAPPVMQQGGEPDGGMALGQIAAVVDKMSKLSQMIGPNSDLEPWISSKLSVMDHYADAVSDYMMYNPEAQGEMMEEPQGLPMPEMKNGGGIPDRYKNMGFTKVGVKKESTRPGKKWMVLAQKGNQYKVVHGGYDGMKDFSQHGSEKRKENFWNRMGGKNSSKATDPFSPLYWHKRFGTWEDGGETGGGYIPVGAPTPNVPISREYVQMLTDKYNQHYSKAHNVQSPMRPVFEGKDDGYDSFWYDEYLPSLKPVTRYASGYLLKDAKDPNEKRFVETEKEYPPKLGKNKDNRFSTEWVENYEIQGRPSTRLESDVVNALADKSRQMSPFLRGDYAEGGYVGYDGKRHMSNTPTWSGNVGYQTGGSVSDEERAFEEQMMRDAEAYNVPPPEIRIPLEFQETAAPAAKKVVRNTGSIVDYLASKGQASDYATRAKLAASMGIKNYRGTADQNIALLQTLSGAAPKDIATPKTGSKRVVQNDEPVWTNKSDLAPITIIIPRKKPNSQSSTPKQTPEIKKGFMENLFGAKTADEYIANDPYFFAEEDDPAFVKLLDMPFTALRNQGARVALDADPFAIASLLLEGAATNRYGKKSSAAGEKVGKKYAEKKLELDIKRAFRNPQVIQSSVPTPKNILVGPTSRQFSGPNIGTYLAPVKKQGGGIHINPANKGKFTASAQRAGMGVQEFAQHVMANREDYSPTQVKRANFARNAAKWNKQEGGPVEGDVMDVTPEQLEMLKAQGYQFEIL